MTYYVEWSSFGKRELPTYYFTDEEITKAYYLNYIEKMINEKDIDSITVELSYIDEKKEYRRLLSDEIMAKSFKTFIKRIDKRLSNISTLLQISISADFGDKDYSETLTIKDVDAIKEYCQWMKKYSYKLNNILPYYLIEIDYKYCQKQLRELTQLKKQLIS